MGEGIAMVARDNRVAKIGSYGNTAALSRESRGVGGERDGREEQSRAGLA